MRTKAYFYAFYSGSGQPADSIGIGLSLAGSNCAS